jgi:hypothetical protein
MAGAILGQDFAGRYLGIYRFGATNLHIRMAALPWRIPASFRSQSDANLLWNVDCKPVILAPGQLAKAYTHDEFVSFEQVARAAHLYREVLRALHRR